MSVPLDLTDTTTPALVLDETRLRANCERMLARCRDLGVRLRPHLKTLKSIDAARIAIDPAHGGLAAATLKEAEYFAQAGVSDIQYAVCLAPTKLARAAAILERAPGFSFFLDSVEGAQMTAAAASPPGQAFRVWIEIDSGEHRTGLAPDSPDLTAVAEALAAGGVQLEGVATHAGQSYGDFDAAALAAIAETERSAVVQAASRLREAGFDCPGVSAGSTPTATHMRTAEGLTEVRAGVYMAGDLFQAGLGAAPRDSLAVSVLATVISHDRIRNQIVVDAGGLALSKDRSTASLPGRDAGYGLVADLEGAFSLGPLHVAEVHQEHGQIRGAEETLPFDRLPLGAKVRIFPNHVCMTAAMYDRYLVVAGSPEVRHLWARTNGWS